MIIFLKDNELPLNSRLDRPDFLNLLRMSNAGDVSVSLSVFYGERAGFIPLEDIDVEKTTGHLANYP